jgi:hypothetical protein
MEIMKIFRQRRLTDDWDWIPSDEEAPRAINSEEWEKADRIDLTVLPAGTLVDLSESDTMVNYLIQAAGNGKIKLWLNGQKGCFIGPATRLGNEGIISASLVHFPYFRWYKDELVDYLLPKEMGWVQNFRFFRISRPGKQTGTEKTTTPNPDKAMTGQESTDRVMKTTALPPIEDFRTTMGAISTVWSKYKTSQSTVMPPITANIITSYSLRLMFLLDGHQNMNFTQSVVGPWTTTLREIYEFFDKGSQAKGSNRRSQYNKTATDVGNLIEGLRARITGGSMNAKGGIDFNPAQMSMEIKNPAVGKEGIASSREAGLAMTPDFSIDPAQVTGATFTIRTMTTVTNLPLILGLNQPAQSNEG